MARFGIDWKLPEGWKWKRLGDVTIKTELCDPRKLPDEPFFYVDIASVNNETGEIREAKELLGQNAPSRARKRIRAGDVIVATTRPYLRGVADVPERLDGQVCSTGFCVLRSNGLIDQRYLYFFARSNFLIEQLTAKMHGASYPAVTDREVFDSEIPLPPLAEQARIVAKLERIERARRAQKQAIEQTQALLKSALAQVFDTKESLPKGWKVWRLEDATSEIYRYPSFYNILYEPDGVAVIRGEHIDEEGHFNTDLSAYSFISRETNTRYARTILKTDDLVMSVRGTIGKIGYVDSNFEGANITANLLRIAPREGVSLGRFLWYLLRSELGQSLIGSLTTGTTLQTIKAGLLKEMQVPLPPLSVQQRIVAKLDRIQRALKLQRQALQKIDALMQAALHKAFRGEL